MKWMDKVSGACKALVEALSLSISLFFVRMAVMIYDGDDLTSEIIRLDWSTIPVIQLEEEIKVKLFRELKILKKYK